MKKTALLVIFFSFVVALPGASVKDLDEKAGFRNFKFGDPISAFINFKETERSEDQKTRFYINLKENKKIGDYSVNKITYGFYNGQFFWVWIEIKGYLNSRGILKIYQSQYGSGIQPNEYIETYYWFGEKVSLTYEENSISRDSSIIYSYKPLSQKQTDDENARAAQAGQDI